jgi:hypothetical protein
MPKVVAASGDRRRVLHPEHGRVDEQVAQRAAAYRSDQRDKAGAHEVQGRHRGRITVPGTVIEPVSELAGRFRLAGYCGA